MVKKILPGIGGKSTLPNGDLENVGKLNIGVKMRGTAKESNMRFCLHRAMTPLVLLTQCRPQNPVDTSGHSRYIFWMK
jgi:hypothetical protein